jgi:flagellar hook-basal body complex protein FliE
VNTITPIQGLDSISGLNKTSPALSGGSSASPEIPFKSMFEDAVNNVKQTDANLNDEVYKLATGQSDNVHDVAIASQKASLSVDLLVQLRDKVLDAYNGIMQMSV